MKTMNIKNYFLTAAIVCFCISCGDGVNLPSIGTETDLTKIPKPTVNENLIEVQFKDETLPMDHNGGLHTPEDFERVKKNRDSEPWKTQLEMLRASGYAKSNYSPRPQETITRYGGSGYRGNYMLAEKDVAAAYQTGLRYHLGDGEEYAKKTVEILNAWAATCKAIDGGTDKALAFGLLGYEFAVSGELIREYWVEKDATGFKRFQQWMVDIFYPGNADFIAKHFDTPNFHYWTNWFFANIVSEIAIGIVADRRDIYNEGIKELQVGNHSGRFTYGIYHVFDGEYANLAQWQESGRDAGHTFLCQGLLATICQLTWGQGDDFFAYDNNRFLKGCEYNSRYHVMGMSVPYVPFTKEYKQGNGIVNEYYDVIAERSATEGIEPFWALTYNHYIMVKGVEPDKCQYTKVAMSRSFNEVNSDKYSQFGLFSPAGMLMFAPDEN